MPATVEVQRARCRKKDVRSFVGNDLERVLIQKTKLDFAVQEFLTLENVQQHFLIGRHAASPQGSESLAQLADRSIAHPIGGAELGEKRVIRRHRHSLCYASVDSHI